MRKIITIISLSISLFSATSAIADRVVSGHYKSNGTYVQPYIRSDADGNPYNNRGTRW